MVEVYVGERKDATVWQPRPTDPQLEAEFLARLMVKLGAKDEQARAVVAAAAAAPAGAGARARASPDRPAPTLQVDDGFDRAWRRVGLALDRSGFTVEDRDRTQGLYFVRYVDPTFAGREEPGFFGKLFSFGKKPTRTRPGQVPRQGHEPKAAHEHRRGARLAGPARERRGRQAHRQPAARRPEVSRAARRPRRVIRFCSLGSGSSGNATVVEASERHHDDAGCWSTAASRCASSTPRLARAGLAAADLDAVFVTHEHGDHIGCALALAAPRAAAGVDEPRHLARHRRPRRRRRRCASRATARRSPSATSSCSPSPSPHDAAEPLQLRCSDGGVRLGVLTDLGSITPHMLDNVAGCDALRARVQPRRATAGRSRAIRRR